nr:hypothetical protein [Tanacetum cinerariifolium]
RRRPVVAEMVVSVMVTMKWRLWCGWFMAMMMRVRWMVVDGGDDGVVTRMLVMMPSTVDGSGDNGVSSGGWMVA